MADVFSGIGGLRIPFEARGGRCVFSAERDRYARQTYQANFTEAPGHIFADDIEPYADAPERIPAHDLLLAGFPCQPFSLAGVSKRNSLGRAHGFADEAQGTLFFSLAKIVRHHRPAAFLFENVRNLVSHDRGRTFRVIMHTLEAELGYHVSYRVISSAPWVPQNRQRIFIVGFRDWRVFSFDAMKHP